MIGTMRTIKVSAFLALLIFAVGVGFFALSKTPAHAAETVCRAVVVLDRSRSVGVPVNYMPTLQENVRRLFLPPKYIVGQPYNGGGLYTDNIELAFWSFSANTPMPNYNAPFNGFVSSKGPINTTFNQKLTSMVPNGATDYEQGFAHNSGTRNNLLIDPQDNQHIIDKANIIVFMTDGLPNTPASATNQGSGADGNSYARSVARNAVLKLKVAGKIVLGGIVGNHSRQSLNFVLTGNPNDESSTFTVDTNYGNLTQKLAQTIGNTCDALNPAAEPYALTPSVTTNNQIITGTDGATFSYNVNNSAASGTTDETTWSIKQVKVHRGQSTDPLLFGNSAYRDGYSCAQLEALINGQGECTDVMSGQKVFGVGNNSLDSDAAAATTVIMDDEWEAGTKVCFVLTLDRPTHQSQPTNRFSKAACLTVGKRPSVHVWGGDLKVGRRFVRVLPFKIKLPLSFW